MQKTNAEILNHFYSLLIEMNFHRPENDPGFEKESLNDPFVQKHLRKIHLMSAKYKSLNNKNKFLAVIDEIKRLRDLGMDEIRKLIPPEQAILIQPLFRRFEELTDDDKASIAEDQELLQLIRALKDKLNKPQNE